MSGIRINRYLASCGLGSRRTCEQLVREGRVSLNGRPVGDLAERVAPRDVVLLDGEPIQPDRVVVLVLNKPRGVLCTRSDPRGRPTVYDLLPVEFHHLAHVGRLDRESEGLLVLTNSGELSQALTRPTDKIDKEYLVQVDRSLSGADREAFLSGMEIEEGFARAVAVDFLQPRLMRMVLQQGLKRQIRMMCEARGHKVLRLVRTRIGSFSAPRLQPGKWRKLRAAEVAGLQQHSAPPGPRRKAGGAVAPPPPVRPPPKLRPPPKVSRPAAKPAARRKPAAEPPRAAAAGKPGRKPPGAAPRAPAGKRRSPGPGRKPGGKQAPRGRGKR
jgi:23S rRNA pseudouridine2605 synthase